MYLHKPKPRSGSTEVTELEGYDKNYGESSAAMPPPAAMYHFKSTTKTPIFPHQVAYPRKQDMGAQDVQAQWARFSQVFLPPLVMGGKPELEGTDVSKVQTVEVMTPASEGSESGLGMYWCANCCVMVQTAFCETCETQIINV